MGFLQEVYDELRLRYGKRAIAAANGYVHG